MDEHLSNHARGQITALTERIDHAVIAPEEPDWAAVARWAQQVVQEARRMLAA